jgi:putative transposase
VSQAKTTDNGELRDLNAGKKIMGRKRPIAVDTLGPMVGRLIHATGIQVRDGAPAVPKSILKHWPWLRHVFADRGDLVPTIRRTKKQPTHRSDPSPK